MSAKEKEPKVIASSENWNVWPSAGEAPTMIIHASTPVRVAQTTPRLASAETIISKAIEIDKEIAEHKLDLDKEKDRKELDELLTAMQDKHKDFASSFPVPLRWIVQLRKFSVKAFRKFITHYHAVTKNQPASSSTTFKTREEFLSAQVEYCMYYEKEINPKYDQKKLVELRRGYMTKLLKEEKELTAKQKLIMDKLEETRKKEISDARAALLKHLKPGAPSLVEEARRLQALYVSAPAPAEGGSVVVAPTCTKVPPGSEERVEEEQEH